MNKIKFGLVASLCLMGAVTSAAQAQYGYGGRDEIILYNGANYSSTSKRIDGPIERLTYEAFNDKAGSVDIRGPNGWLLCKDSRFEGPCLVARQSIRDLDDFGMDDELSSVRPLSRNNPYPHGTIFGQDWSGDLVFYKPSGFGGLTEMTDEEAWGYEYGSNGYGYERDGYRSGQYGRYGYYDPYDTRDSGYDQDWSGYRGARNADIILYRDPFRRGSAFGANRDIFDFDDIQFNDEVSSIEVRRGRWEICTDAEFHGRCEVIDTTVDTLGPIQFNDNISSIRRVSNRGDWPDRDRPGNGRPGGWGDRDDHRDPPVSPPPARPDYSRAEVVIYEHGNFEGKAAPVNGSVSNLKPLGMNDNISSIKVQRGRWEVCVDPEYRGRCVAVDGNMSSLSALRMNDNISSIRKLGD